MCVHMCTLPGSRLKHIEIVLYNNKANKLWDHCRNLNLPVTWSTYVSTGQVLTIKRSELIYFNLYIFLEARPYTSKK